LGSYHLAHSARADFLRKLGRIGEAAAAYEKALSLCQQAPEQAFLRKRISELAASAERQ
jgi:RNA polymerase sigma-70 factor (ECF subfamily)